MNLNNPTPMKTNLAPPRLIPFPKEVKRALPGLPHLMLFLLLLLLPAAVQAQFACYTNLDGSITISGYAGPGGAVNIPSEINGLPVTSIDRLAFLHCTSLTSVTIPNSVTAIGIAAFSGCTGLKSVIIGNGVIYMDYGAFLDCTGLTSAYFEGDQALSLPEHVYPMHPYVFGGCPFATVFYLAGASGWGAMYELAPTAVWVPRPTYVDWAVSSGLTAQFPAASGEADDPDGDGFTNGQEWFAGTAPVQNTSRLQLELTPRPADLSASDQTPIPAGQRAVYFRSVPGRYYGVQSAVDLGGTWELQATRIAAPGTTQTRILLPIPGPQAFYRVEALP